MGNLSDNVDEKMLRDCFNSFGIVLATKVMRDPETGKSKNYGMYDTLENVTMALKFPNI